MFAILATMIDAALLRPEERRIMIDLKPQGLGHACPQSRHGVAKNYPRDFTRDRSRTGREVFPYAVFCDLTPVAPVLRPIGSERRGI